MCKRVSAVLAVIVATVTVINAAIPTPVAYWPMRDGMPGTTPSGSGAIDDVIDDATHPCTDATPNNNNSTFVADPLRGIVWSTTEGNRLTAGQQGIDLNVHAGWTWAFWVKSSSSNITDPGADVLMGSRNGTWNKMDRNGCSNWINPNYGTQGDMSDDTWHHIVFVGDTSGGSIYIDGVFMNKDTTFNGGALRTDIADDPMEIGGSSRYSEDTTGLYSDVAVWDVALTEAQILELYNGSNVITDSTAPFIASTAPADDDPDAPVHLLQAILDEPIVAGTGNILIVNDTDGTTNTIAVTDGAQVTVAGAAITLNPATPLLVGKAYHIEMDPGVVQNIEGLPFAGITNATDWNFTSDSTPPTLVSMEDSVGGGPIYEDLIELSYTVTFNEPMDAASVTTNDFDNEGTATISIGSVTAESPTVFTVVVNPSSTGSLQLRIPTGSVVTDLSGNALVLPVLDDTTITINAGTTPVTGILYWDGPTTSGGTDGISQGGDGSWDQTTTSWDMGFGFAGPFAWDNSAAPSAVIGSPQGSTASTLTLTEDITVKDITFENVNNNQTITGQTLNFVPDATITTLMEDYNRTYTISSQITGSPNIRVNSADQNKHLVLDPGSGTMELGVLTNPFYDGYDGDKAAVHLRGTSHGNTLAGADYINTNPETGTSRNCHYGYLYKEDSGTWTINGDVGQGRIFTESGTLIINGKFTSLYAGFGVPLPSGFKLGGNMHYYKPDSRSGWFRVGTGAIVSPGDPNINDGVGAIIIDHGNRNDATQNEFSDGAIYEWDVGAGTNDVIHLVNPDPDARNLILNNFVLKIRDAGGSPAGTDMLPVFTYDSGTTINMTAFGNTAANFDVTEVPTWNASSLALADDNNGTVYLTGLSAAAPGTMIILK